ncbi:uncharacterized protein BJ171DRAFT_589718 [Polychytrium aggregatum]|uniref:uncharacterized protein n=1 Tax=Polychytrium aggregatum TaxID=110093 RepID=UPI0022FE7445|nr:uncharacterized protein BJ171DRAFT_593289 [Polychytrium aggregatum]XP_052961621.1 uncharacterized protein BJ171DRAFT_591458 [Polychytrium aggregatum]XP_052961936.1 uncharacterized protein BJ171DRAFT_589718 [Polychytrium aggregatum]KAI9188498.1 hypothetical protein BJ171DRAFT_593289 [Polychytrium aggregatum]KAI9190644.1 hypothetical protein BJ171DRAFT_591458 [Polychytrium aggregatum]KAI9192998.1 hypothetical protein BJ171DRAFT_589718 [Polychytrium aggregatum]
MSSALMYIFIIATIAGVLFYQSYAQQAATTTETFSPLAAWAPAAPAPDASGPDAATIPSIDQVQSQGLQTGVSTALLDHPDDPAFQQNFLFNQFSSGITLSQPKKWNNNDIRGSLPPPQNVVSPWLQSTTEPDMLRKRLEVV